MICNRLKQCFCHKQFWKSQSESFKCFTPVSYFLSHSQVVRMPFVCRPYVNRLYSSRTQLVCHSYVNRMYSYVTSMCSYIIFIYSHVIRMSLVCTLMLSVSNSYVVICHGMSLVCTRMSSVRH